MAANVSEMPVTTSVPDAILRHNISDEELDMLCSGRKDMVLEFLWISIGVLVGSVPSALSAMTKYGKGAVNYSMPIDDLAQIILFWLGLVMTIVLGIVSSKRGKRAKDLQKTIRDRAATTATL